MAETLAAHGLPELLAGRFRLERILGQGAFGFVVRATDERLQRPVAVKVLAARAKDPRVLDRFGREAALTARLRHPNVVQVYDHGVEPDGRLWIAYELVTGTDLAHRLEDAAPLPPGTAHAWAEALADALSAIHAAGLVHRDVKPGNVLLRGGETPVLADFGLAIDTGRETRLTETGVLVGTPVYMPPELFLGLPSTAAGDQYAWAAITFELAYRRRLRGKEEMASLMAGNPEAARLPALGAHPALDRILKVALANDPAGRFPDMAAVRAALAGAGDASARPRCEALPPVPDPEVLPPTLALPRTGSGSGPRPGLPLAPLALVGLLTAVAAFGLAPGGALDPPAPGTPPPSSGAPGEPDRPSVATLAAKLLADHAGREGSLDGRGLAHSLAVAEGLLDPRLPLRLRRLLEGLEAAWPPGGPELPDPQTVQLPRHLFEDLYVLEHELTNRASQGTGTADDTGRLPRSLEQLRAFRAEAEAMIDRVMGRPAPVPAGLLEVAARLGGQALSMNSERLLRTIHVRLLEGASEADLGPLLRGRIALGSLSDRGVLPCESRKSLADELLAAAGGRAPGERQSILVGLLPELVTGAVLCPDEARDLVRIDTALDGIAELSVPVPEWIRESLGVADTMLGTERGVYSRRGSADPALAERLVRIRALRARLGT